MFFQLLGSLILAYLLWRFVKRWSTKSSPFVDVPGPPKDHWLKGNYHQIFNKEGWNFNLQLAEKYGGAVKIHSLLGGEQLYISDPRALHHLVVKEQDVYEETDMFIKGNKMIFGEGLLSTLGDQHRKQRKMLNPVFSIVNMRELLPVIQPVASELRSRFIAELSSSSGEKEIDVMKWMSRAALDYICQAGMGYSSSALDTSKTNEYAEAVKMLSPTAFRLVILRPFVPFVVRTIPLYWRTKIIDWLPLKSLKEMRRIVGVMDKTSRNIFAEKVAALTNPDVEEQVMHPISRRAGKDIMSVLLRANASASEEDRLSEKELLGQMNTFIFAAFETTTSALSRILHILAQKPEAQARLRKEIRDAKLKYASSIGIEDKLDDLELLYDTLMSLPHLDSVCRETLRLYPPVLILSRTTRKSTVLPLEFPMQSPSGTPITSIPVPEKTTVIISILAANRNKRIWGEDAAEWKPERWLTSDGKIKIGNREENVQASGNETLPGTQNGMKYPGVYASMMTFLGGGRACIGFKFAEMEMKQVLTTLLPALHFSLPPKEIYWNMSGVQSPVVKPPEGDGTTPQLPLIVRTVREEDYEH